MSKKPAVLFLIIILFALPFVAGALDFPSLTAKQDFNVTLALDGVINIVWQIFLGVSILMFIIAGFMFVTGHGDPAKTGAAKQAVIYGVIGIIVAILAFSIATIISNILAGNNVGGGGCGGFGTSCQQGSNCCSGSCIETADAGKVCS